VRALAEKQVSSSSIALGGCECAWTSPDLVGRLLQRCSATISIKST